MKYQISSIIDLLAVPIDRREDCMREILHGLALCELAGVTPDLPIDWTDDGKKHISVTVSEVNNERT